MSRPASSRGNRSASMPARLPRDGSRHASTLGSHSKPRVPCTPRGQIDRYVPSPSRRRRKDRYLPQRPRILTSQRQLDHRVSPADNRQEAPKPQRLAMPTQKSIPNKVSVPGNSQSLQTPQPSPVASSREDASPAFIPTSEMAHRDAMIYSPQSHPIQNIELGSCDRPIIIPSTPRPKSRILQPVSSLQVRRDTTIQEVSIMFTFDIPFGIFYTILCCKANV